jgi:hypothetical protein
MDLARDTRSKRSGSTEHAVPFQVIVLIQFGTEGIKLIFR